LSYNNIKIIPSHTFSGLKKLKKVFLTKNKVESIESKAFWDLPSLEEIQLAYNQIKFLRSEAFGDFKEMPNLSTIELKGSDQIESIDLITLINLNKLDKDNVNILKTIKTKDVDYFTGGFNKITEELIDAQIRVSFEINFTKFFAIGLLLKSAIFMDRYGGCEDHKQQVQCYLRTFEEQEEFDGFKDLLNHRNDEEFTEATKEYIISFLKKKLVKDIFYHTLIHGVSEMFTILDKFSLSFESDILVNYIKRREYTKFDELIKRFLILSKEPIKNNSYFILLNCILWTDDENGTLFEYVLNGEILSEKYSKKDLLESLLSLNGHYSECKSEYIQFTPHIEATLKRNNYEIYRTLLYSKNQRNCLIYSIASYGSNNRQLTFLLKDKNQLKILASLSSVNETESPLERIIQDIDGISNNTIKQIIDKYLDIDTELRVPVRLNSKSIEFLAKRNEAYLFKILLDNTKVLDEKSSKQLVNFNNFKINIRNATNQSLRIALEQNN
jgi:hypothetical protein